MDHFLRGFANELIKTAVAQQVGGTPAFNPFKTQKIPTQALQSPKGPPTSNVRQRATASPRILSGAGKVPEQKVKKVKKKKVKKPLGDSSSIRPWETASQKRQRIQTNMRTAFNKRKESQKAAIAKTTPQEQKAKQSLVSSQPTSSQASPARLHRMDEQNAQQSFPKAKPVLTPQQQQRQAAGKQIARVRKDWGIDDASMAAAKKIKAQKKWRRIQTVAKATKRGQYGTFGPAMGGGKM